MPVRFVPRCLVCLLPSLWLACAASGAEPVAAPETPNHGVEPRSAERDATPDAPSGEGAPWTTGAEQAGAVTDGVTITSVQHETSDDVQRLVLDFDGAGPVPRTVLEVGDAATTLLLTVHGVRSAPREVPLLVGEDGRKIADPIATSSSPLVSYGRTFFGDDSAVRFELRLDRNAPHRLIASESPRRLTLELQR